jgi:hypothetical protein
MDHPGTATGALHAVVLGAMAALIALVVAQYFPLIIPSRASSVQL